MQNFIKDVIIMFDNKIKVYVKLDKNNCIVDINSSIFIKDTKDYICIDEGNGDKYSHAQGNYLEKSLVDSQGRYNYKYVDNKVVELTEEEKEQLFKKPEPQISEIDKIKNKLEQNSANIEYIAMNTGVELQ